MSRANNAVRCCNYKMRVKKGIDTFSVYMITTAYYYTEDTI